MERVPTQIKDSNSKTRQDYKAAEFAFGMLLTSCLGKRCLLQGRQSKRTVKWLWGSLMHVPSTQPFAQASLSPAGSATPAKIKFSPS